MGRYIAVVCISLSVIIMTIGCSGNQKAEGFAIYLPARDIPISEMPIISNLELTDRPIISLGDIVSYYRDTHEIELIAKAHERLLEVYGKVFVVCVDRQPVYWGAFWTPVSSIPFDGLTILLSPDRQTIQLELGYPSGYFNGDDPRPDPKTIQSLELAGKIKLGY